MYGLIKHEGEFGVTGESVRVLHITTDPQEANMLLNLLNDYEVSRYHIYDVIEDFWGMI